MPDWTPIWSDVAFDHAAAETAVATCRSAAQGIDEVTGEMPAHRDAALEEWSGRFADDFSVEEGAVASDLRTVARDLRALARSIESGAEAATAAQARRVADRERWRREVAAEKAAAEEDADRRATPHGAPRLR